MEWLNPNKHTSQTKQNSRKRQQQNVAFRLCPMWCCCILITIGNWIQIEFVAEKARSNSGLMHIHRNQLEYKGRSLLPSHSGWAFQLRTNVTKTSKQCDYQGYTHQAQHTHTTNWHLFRLFSIKPPYYCDLGGMAFVYCRWHNINSASRRQANKRNGNYEELSKAKLFILGANILLENKLK